MAAIVVSRAMPSYVRVSVLNGSTWRNSRPPAANVRHTPSSSTGDRPAPNPADDDGATVGETQVHLEAALVPGLCDRLDPDSREIDRALVVGDPHRGALTELRILGPFSEEVVT